MRSALRELPCGGRGGNSSDRRVTKMASFGADYLGSCPPGWRNRSGVAQWQSERLLTVRLWVRVPPPELSRRRSHGAAFVVSGRPVSLPRRGELLPHPPWSGA